MKKYVFFMVSVIFLVSGCAWGTRRPYLTYSPVSLKRPGNGIVIKVKDFEDRRAIRDTVGYSRNTYGMRCAKVVPENSVTEWVTDALKSELRNEGYAVRDAGDASNIIEGVVFDIFCDTYFSYEGRANIKVVLKRDGKVVMDKNYAANKDGGMNWAATSKSFAATLELALQDVMGEAIFDINRAIEGKNNS